VRGSFGAPNLAAVCPTLSEPDKENTDAPRVHEVFAVELENAVFYLCVGNMFVVCVCNTRCAWGCVFYFERVQLQMLDKTEYTMVYGGLFRPVCTGASI